MARRTIPGIHQEAGSASNRSDSPRSPRLGRRGPGQGGRRGKSRPGRATARAGSQQSSRYTPPIPRNRRKSPAWMGILLLAFLIAGVLVIMLNYLGVLPNGASNWYLLGGLGMIFVGFAMATRYH
ncbi:MAG: cell division protein CrgA [Acidimicrobiales bacterium]